MCDITSTNEHVAGRCLQPRVRGGGGRGGCGPRAGSNTLFFLFLISLSHRSVCLPLLPENLQA